MSEDPQGVPGVALSASFAATTAQRMGADPARSAWVEASAGSGKTQVLRDRVLRLLLSGVDPGKILCITYTKAAAAEMSVRIARILADWAAMDDKALDVQLKALSVGRSSASRAMARTLFARLLDVPGGMKIETIHGFCQSLLRRFPLEAGVSPHFTLMEERDSKELLRDMRDGLFVAAQEKIGGALAQALLHLTGRLHETRLGDLLDALMQDRGRLLALRQRSRDIAAIARALRRVIGLDAEESVETFCARVFGDDAMDVAGLRRAAAILAGTGMKADGQNADALHAFLAASASDRRGLFADYWTVFFTQKNERRARPISNSAQERMSDILAVLDAEALRLEAIAQTLKAFDVLKDTLAVTTLALDLLDRYESAKAARARLDYDDLIYRVRDLLLKPGIAPWILYKLDNGIEHVLLDEAQDSNPAQWAIVKALTEDFFAGAGAVENLRTVFAVGDVKQSIYSFQRADPAGFVAARGHFAARAGDAFARVELNVSFRSGAAVLDCVDAVFAAAEAHEGLLFGTVDAISHQVHRIGQGGCVELWPLMTPPDSDEAAADDVDEAAWALPVIARPSLAPPAERLAELTATRIEAMIAKGDVLAATGRAVAPGDILVLVRSRNAFVPLLVRALKRRGVPVSGIDRMRLLDEIAVMDLMAFASFLLLPDDDLNLAALLKSPLVGATEEELFTLAADRGEASLWAHLGALAARSERFAAIRAPLAAYLARADYGTPFDLYADLLGRGGGRQRFYARLGTESGDVLDEFLNLALRYERAHTPSLQGFLSWLQTSEVEIKREMDEAAAGQVRIMTVHGAKGLQAPIVILADYLRPPRPPSGLFWHETGDLALPLYVPRKDGDIPATEAARARAAKAAREEENRLLYVALTRAEDRLYVCGWRGRKKTGTHGWHDLVQAGLARLERVETIATAEQALPGQQGQHLYYGVEQRAAYTEKKTAASAVAPDAPLPAWALQRAPSEAPPRALAPSRQTDGGKALDFYAETPLLSPLGIDHGYGYRRGRIIHRLLEILPALPPATRLSAAQHWLARPNHALDAEQRAEILGEVMGILTHPDHAILFDENGLAEVPVVAALMDADKKPFILSGQIDRLIVTSEAAIIIDYKSNRPPPMRIEHVSQAYLRQMAAYRLAVRNLYPEKPVRCLFLWTALPKLMALPDALLDAYTPT